MKTKRVFMLLIIAASTITFSEAQVLRQLKQKVIDKTVDAVVESTADKVAEKSSAAINKSIDKAINKHLGDMAGVFDGFKDVESLPASYDFDYIYTLQMRSNSESNNVNYYLSSSGNHTAARMEQQGNMLVIFDVINSAVVTVVNGIAMATGLNTNKLSEVNLPDNNYKTSPLPDKKFLGYNCKGMLMEDGDETLIVYFVPNMTLGLSSGLNPGIVRLPGKTAVGSSQFESGLVMYMESQNKKDKKGKKNVVIECVDFKKSKSRISVR